MTEQEAIKALEFDMEMILFDPYEGKKRTPEQVKAINEANYLCYLADEMAIKALEKQIAKKPLGEYTQCKCSVCGRRVRSGRGSSSFVRDNFCQRCGQAIDWE